MNPFVPDVPCYRVVAVDRSLCGYIAGLEVKRKLLEEEGLGFDQDDRILGVCWEFGAADEQFCKVFGFDVCVVGTEYVLLILKGRYQIDGIINSCIIVILSYSFPVVFRNTFFLCICICITRDSSISCWHRRWR